MRGYGDSSAPEGANNYTYLHIVGDLIGLLDALKVEKAFVVGHDWGAMVSWQLVIFRPDRVIALANLSVYYSPRNPNGSMVTLMRKYSGGKHYMCKFQVGGKILSNLLEFNKLTKRTCELVECSSQNVALILHRT
ncbi:hypothetical protein KP509_15G003000 [Ceratopteris richardii]|uniref:AB hydrolase-1 domain-containing protein n=1 Tax=Ceratopteris richardii TaxID=49495 RepID=A0A8T2T2K1_CERRI|nr:hypothetical protein KP509_15G003000 [Ceratopteris richardii]